MRSSTYQDTDHFTDSTGHWLRLASSQHGSLALIRTQTFIQSLLLHVCKFRLHPSEARENMAQSSVPDLKIVEFIPSYPGSLFSQLLLLQ